MFVLPSISCCVPELVVMVVLVHKAVLHHHLPIWYNDPHLPPPLSLPSHTLQIPIPDSETPHPSARKGGQSAFIPLLTCIARSVGSGGDINYLDLPHTPSIDLDPGADKPSPSPGRHRSLTAPCTHPHILPSIVLSTVLYLGICTTSPLQTIQTIARRAQPDWAGFGTRVCVCVCCAHMYVWNMCTNRLHTYGYIG